MAKKQAKGVYLTSEIIESQSFHNLSGTAKEILLLFLLKRSFPTIKIKGKPQRICTNWNKINFCYSEAKKRGFSQKRFTRAIDDLLAKGFISIVHPGGGFEKDKAVYMLLTEPESTNRWRIWCKGTVFESRTKESVTRGFCKPKRDGIS